MSYDTIEPETVEKVRKVGEAKHGTDVFNVLAHVSQFWLDDSGSHCAYCGRYQYMLDDRWSEEHTDCCVHVAAMKEIRVLEKIVDEE